MDKRKSIFRIIKLKKNDDSKNKNSTSFLNEEINNNLNDNESFDPHKNYFIKYWEQWKENEIILSQIKEKSFILKQLNKSLSIPNK